MKILKLLFSRVVIVGFILFLQVAYFLILLFRLGNYSTEIHAAFTMISIVVVLYIVNKNDNPGYKLAWIVPILAFPLFGGILYVAMGDKKPARKMRKKLELVGDFTNQLLYQKPEIIHEIEEEHPQVAGQVKYLQQSVGYPVYKNTQTKYFPIGEEYYEALLEELNQAKHFIFMEYFIVEEGAMWNNILEVLERKAKEGIDVRFMYDDVGCVTLLPYQYYKQLEAKGIKSIAVNPFRPIFSVAMNNRDHRKIAVIDGHTGFTGGVNLADEYINQKVRFGHWKDTGIMLKGDAVWSMTIMFLQMWNANRPTDHDYAQYRPHVHHNEHFDGDGYVLPYGDSPLDSETTGENVYLNMINNAKKYVYVLTPYLITDNEMMSALSLAAKRGIDVRIITPGIPDKKIVFKLTQSYYPQLIKAGVKVYQYAPGFLHAKCVVSDDEVATVGTINFDYRSLYLHFENGVFLYKTDSVNKVKEDVLDTISKCEEIRHGYLKHGLVRDMFRAIFRLFAPLM